MRGIRGMFGPAGAAGRALRSGADVIFQTGGPPGGELSRPVQPARRHPLGPLAHLQVGDHDQAVRILSDEPDRGLMGVTPKGLKRQPLLVLVPPPGPCPSVASPVMVVICDGPRTGGLRGLTK